MKIISSLVWLGLVLGGTLAAAPKPLPNPDFTKGEAIPEGATKDWNLGATGARGWIYTNQLSTAEARRSPRGCNKRTTRKTRFPACSTRSACWQAAIRNTCRSSGKRPNGRRTMRKEDQKTMKKDPVFTMRPIGTVQNVAGKPVGLKINDEYVEGLEGLEHCSHVMVLWWFDKNDTPEKRRTLKVHPCGDERNPLTGVFATRSPRRPNLIAV